MPCEVALVTFGNARRRTVVSCEASAKQWDAIPVECRRENAARAWTAAGRLEWHEHPRAAREYFRRALRHRAEAKTAGYWLVTPAMSVIKRDRSQPA
ncbi:MAG: hypothetical protein ABIY47_18435 [Opitutaceae bacterium]